MKDLSTLPGSVCYQLSKADHLVEQDRPAGANSTPAEPLTTLARTNPKCCALFFGSELGFKQLACSQRKTALGVCYGEDVTTVTTENLLSKSIRFG